MYIVRTTTKNIKADINTHPHKTIAKQARRKQLPNTSYSPQPAPGQHAFHLLERGHSLLNLRLSLRAITFNLVLVIHVLLVSFDRCNKFLLTKPINFVPF